MAQKFDNGLEKYSVPEFYQFLAALFYITAKKVTNMTEAWSAKDEALFNNINLK